MFSDRWWVLKAAAALGLLALLCNDTRRTMNVRYPEVERIVLHWEQYRDHTFHLAGKKVQSADATGFVIATRVGPLRILTPTPPAADDYVTVNLKAVGPRTLQATELEILEGYFWKRPLNYGISIVTLLAYLWLVRRRFRWRIHEGVLRSRY